jgi:succinate dehydrogenase flavin-adding protein (antitoxin of CptAB toxin-antitoxin module)
MSVIFTSKDISKKLKIGKSRVREISKELEKKEYHFTKNQDTRIYNQNDFELFQMIIKEYQKNENLLQSVEYALNNQSVQSQSEVHVIETTSLENEITENNTPYIPLENNIHKNFDMNNDMELIEIIKNDIDEEADSQIETIDSELIHHSLLEEETPLAASVSQLEPIEVVENSQIGSQDTKQLEESFSQLETIDEFVMEQSFSQDTEKFEESLSQLEIIEEVLIEPSLQKEQHVTGFGALSKQTDQNSEDEEVQEYRFEEMTVEQVLEENKKLPDEVVLSKLNGSNVVTEPIVSKENVTTFVPTNSNQIMFEEFMSQITNLAYQNEQILTQNQTLIKQNLEKDQKLEKILYSVEEKSEELQGLATVIEEKDEKLEQMFEEIKSKESGRDAQLMRMIRELQETKKMVAASKERDWKNAIKSLFFKPKSLK